MRPTFRNMFSRQSAIAWAETRLYRRRMFPEVWVRPTAPLVNTSVFKGVASTLGQHHFLR